MNELVVVEKIAQWQTIEGAGARQRLLADYAARVQHGAGRVHGVVPAGAATRLHARRQ